MGAHDRVLNNLDNLVQIWIHKAAQACTIEQPLPKFSQVSRHYLASPHNDSMEQFIIGSENIPDVADIGAWQ